MATRKDPLIQKLIGTLSDSDPQIRRNAAGALRLHGARALEAIPALTECLADEEPMVRREAKHALDRLRMVAA